MIKDGSRFQLVRPLGRGQFGEVYEATDAARGGGRVAIKRLHHDSPNAIILFKDEFRHASEVFHKNLARLYELHSDGDGWFLSMELVEGMDILSWLDGAEQDEGPETWDGAGEPPEQAAPAGAATTRSPDEIARIFRQLAAGVQALHAASLLHRDLKPSNILIRHDGQVKILDFGLAVLLGGDAVQVPAGTRAYMAPEVWRGDAGPAADWYSLGVILHQILTGALPAHPGALVRLPAAQADQPDWQALARACEGLLQPEPAERLSGAGLQALLGASGPGPAPRPSVDRRPFVGRARELAWLGVAMESLPKIALLFGPSGVGKSALALRFLREVREREGALVLSSRCRQHDRLPFKALDGLVDALSRHLLQLRPEQRAAMLPEWLAEMQQVFPVLGDIAPPAPRARLPPDIHEIRHRAFVALGQLLSGLSQQRRIVLYIDDLQWGDADSGRVLAELFSRRDAPRLLLLGTCRSEEREESDFLNEWAASLRKLEDLGRLTQLQLAPLPADSSRLLVRLLGADSASAERIVRESAGLPIFLETLVEHERLQLPPGQRSLQDAILMRIRALPADAGMLLELVSVADAPLPLSLVAAAGALGSGWDALEMLRGRRLIRVLEGGRITSYHDRIRESVLSKLAPDARAQRHIALAEALEARPQPARDQIAAHLAAAGMVARAAPHAIAAAAEATEALAFEKAASLLAVALLGTDPGDPAHRVLRLQRADALVGAGRGAEAAVIYEEEAPHAADPTALIHLAAEQWMTTGHLDEGIARFSELLTSAGMHWPATARQALVRILLDVLRLRLTPLSRWGVGAPPADAAALQRQADICWSGVRGFLTNDHIRALYFMTRGMVLSLRARDPARIARVGIYFSAQLRTVNLGWGERILMRCQALVTTLESPYLLGMFDFLEGLVQMNRASWRHGARVCLTAAERFNTECTASTWESSTCQIMACECLVQQGDFEGVERIVEDLMPQTERLGDRQGFVGLYTFRGMVLLCHDRPDRAREIFAEILGMWSEHGFHYQHFFNGLRLVYCDLYEDKLADGLARAEEMWRKVHEAGLHRAIFLRFRGMLVRAWAQVAVLAAGLAPPAGLIRDIRWAIRQMERSGRPDALADAIQLTAALAHHSGDRLGAAAGLARAREGFTLQDMTLRALSCELRRLDLTDAPDTARQEVRQALASHGVENSARWVATFCPGF